MPIHLLRPFFVLWISLAATSAGAQSSSSYFIHTVAGGGNTFEESQSLPGLLWGLLSADATKGMAVDEAGSVYFSSGNRVYKLARNGLVTPVAGNGQYSFGGHGGPALTAQIAAPGGVAVDSLGNLYLAEIGSHRVRKVDQNGIITTLAGNGAAGFSGDGGPATNAQLNTPRDVAVDGSDNVYIADSSNFRIRRVDTNGIITTAAGNGAFAYTGDGGAATAASLTSPTCVAVSSTGNLYFNDFYNHRVRRVDTQGVITTVAGTGPGGIDSGDFSGDGGQARSARLFAPMDVAIDATGNLYIADQRNRRVRKISHDGTIRTIAGTGQLGNSGDGGPALSANLEDPQGVEVDSNGDVFIAAGRFPAVIRLLSPEPLPMPAPSLALATPELPAARIGQPYFSILLADGGQPFVYRWGVAGGLLPDGLSLDGTTGVLSGTPTTAGLFSSTIQVTDRSQATAIKAFTISVEAAVPISTTLTIVTPSPLPRAQVGQPYSVRLQADGAPTPLVWARRADNPIAVGSLPEGLSLDPATGVISGTPQNTYSPPFTIRASYNEQIYTDKIFQLPIDSPAPTPPFLVTLPVEVASPPRSVTSVPGVAFDFSGNIFVSDFERARIQKLAPSGEITTVAGNGTGGFSGDGGLAAQARIAGPTGLACDSAGNLYFADTGNQRVRRISVAGTISTVAGTGVKGSSGDGGTAASAELSDPWGLAFDSLGNLYIADSGNHRVRKITPSGMISTVAGVGTSGFGGDGSPATAARLSGPLGVAVDSIWNLYIADTGNHRVRKVNASGSISTIAGDGRNEFSGDGGPAVAASLWLPFSVMVDPAGNVFVVDTFHHRLRKIGLDGKIQTVTVAFYASSAAFDTLGNIVIGGSDRVYLLPATFPSQPVVTISSPSSLPAGQVDEPYSTYLTAAGSVPFNYAWSVTQGILPDGLTLDNATGRISGTAGQAGTFTFTVEARDYTQTRATRAFTIVIGPSSAGETWILTPYAGTTRDGKPYGGYVGEGRAAESALFFPAGVTVDAAGNLWIADAANHRVRKVTPAGVISTVAGDGTRGHSGDGGPANQAQLSAPVDVAVDSSGNILVAEEQSIRRVTPDGFISTLAGSLQPGFSGDGGPAIEARLSLARSVEADPDGNIYIADFYNHRIRKVSPQGIINTIAGSGAVDQGSSPGGGYGGDGGPATAALLRYPQGIALDTARNLYIADSRNHRIRRVTPNGTIETFAGKGVAGFAGDGGQATQAELRFPGAVEVDAEGNVLIADTGNHRIRRVTPSGIIQTIAGVGSAGFSGDRGPATAAQLDSPRGIAADNTGAIYVSDSNNHQFRKLGRGRASSQIQPVFSWILPSNARARGLAGAFFTTDLTVANTSGEEVAATIQFLGNNQDGRAGPSKIVSLAAGKIVSYHDVLANLFGVSEDWGALRITANSPSLAIHGQTSTAGPTGGSYGHSVLASAPKDLVRNGLQHAIVGIREDVFFRTNLILANATDQPLEVDLSLLSGAGLELGARRVSLPPLGMTQLTQVVRQLGIGQNLETAQLILSTPTPGGSFAAYAALIDNVTNDPRTLSAQWRAAEFPYTWILPSSARAPGIAGAFYTTDLTLSNTAQYALHFSLKFLGNNRNGLVGPSKDLTLEADQSLRLADVLKSVFGLDQDYGAIRLAGNSMNSSFGPGVVVQAQTSTPAPGGGTFGQSVPAASRTDEVREGTTRSIVGVTENAAFRTNLVLANASEAQAEVELRLLNAEGILLGTKRIILQPLGMTQLNRVVREFAVTGDVSNARLVIVNSDPLVGVTAYAAIIDNVTNDPRTLLPQ